MYNLLARFADILARAMAYFGGFILVAIVCLSVASIIGRALIPLDIGLGPIRGIYDLTEMGMAATVFAFLPWCQLKRGHAAVDLFKPVYPRALNRLLDVLVDLGMLIAAVLIGWRLYLGLADKYNYGETTLIMQLPVWQGYAFSLVGAIGFVVVAAFCVIRSTRVLLGKSLREDFA